ncbi:hypothetical protein MP631_18530 [Xanthomonas phaseoli pv. phaseoli]|nr:hypothetical protein MP631_18530 [Xanthomonas phaseoli pv. phaseoli]
MASEEQKELVYRYVEHSDYAPFQGISRSDVVFDDAARRYEESPRTWGIRFSVKEKSFIALIGCDKSVELSIPKQ